MNIYIPLGLILAFICYISSGSSKTSEKFFLFCMTIACGFMAIRYEFGPDYFSYRDIYERDLSFSSLSDLFSGSSEYSLEPTFNFILHLFPKFTYFIVFATILWFTANYLFYSKYVEQKYYWFLMLYMFLNMNCILNNSVALRTSFAAVSFIPAFYFLQNNKRILFILFVALGALFHTSTIALAILVILRKSKKSILLNRAFVTVCFVISLVIILTGTNFIFDSVAGYLIGEVEQFARYANYDVAVSSSINAFIFKILIFVPLLFIINAAEKEEDERFFIVYKIAIIVGVLLLILGQNILSDRFLMILSPFYIAAIIRSFRFNTPPINYINVIIALVVSCYMLYNQMNASYAVSWQVYHTVFSAPTIP